MPPRPKNTKRNVRRLEAQTRVIKTTNRIFIAVIFLCVAIGFFATYWPEKKKLAKLKEQLEEARQRQEVAEGRLDYLHVKLNALKEDPTFLEIQSRDRLQLYRPGETIFRIER